MQSGFGFRALNGLVLVQPKNMRCHTSLLLFRVGLGVGLNLVDTSGRTGFGVNLYAARTARISISSKLLQLAQGVIQ